MRSDMAYKLYLAWGMGLAVLLTGCGLRLEKMSPRQIVKLATKAAASQNHELLGKLAYVPEGQTPKQVQANIDSVIAKSSEYSTAGALFRILFRIKIGREKIYGNRAYVYMHAGSIITPYRPLAVLALAKQDGIWKIRGERRECEPPQLWKQILQTNPEDVDVLYYLGLRYFAEERVMFHSTLRWPDGDQVGDTFVVVPHDTGKAFSYFEEYLRKDPKGFWAPVINNEIGMRMRKEAEILRHAQESIRTNAQDTDAMRVLAGYYRNMGLYRKSKLAAEYFVRLTPHDNKFRRGDALRDTIRMSDFYLAIQKEYFDKNPERLKEVEAELGFRLFEGECTLP